MAKNKIIIADDHPLIRVGIKGMIDQDPDLTVVGEAENGEELLALLAHQKCDLVVTDISMPRVDGLTVVKKIREEFP